MGDTRPRPTPGASPFVDYDAVAERYAVARALDADTRARWRDAALGCLARPPGVVADVGSGTGIFARAWTEWTQADVVGVEPSPAMLHAARSEAVERVRYVRAVAEALPLADRSVDVAWVSTAFHHFADQALAAREMARVLRAGGRVLLRSAVRERTGLPWLELFPGWDRALGRFPALSYLRAVFGQAGLALVDVREVSEPPRTNREVAEWILRMRDADSVLTALTDDEIAAGVRELRRRPDDVVPTALTLLALAAARGSGLEAD